VRTQHVLFLCVKWPSSTIFPLVIIFHHTHATHTHTLSHMHIHSHAHTYTQTLSHTHTLHTHSDSLSLSHPHIHTHYTHTLTLSLTHTTHIQGDIEDLCLTFSVSETDMGTQKEVDLVHLGSKIAVSAVHRSYRRLYLSH
jgi:hypothetical protein